MQLLLLLVLVGMMGTDLSAVCDIVVDNVMLHDVHLLGREQHDVTDAPDRIRCRRRRRRRRCSGDIIFASSGGMHQHQLRTGRWRCKGVGGGIATCHRAVPFEHD
uniref:Putative secreted protein n=1 Tax=Anopheles marajoara TaxID=58244 RepID=A0A2M4C8I0_9DIPT